MGNIVPLKDMFMSFFFVSIGMLLDTGYLLDHLPVLILAAIALIVIKSIAGAVVTFLLGCPSPYNYTDRACTFTGRRILFCSFQIRG